MRTLLDDRFAPITSSIGFLEVPLDVALDALRRWRVELGRATSVAHLRGPLADHLARLEPLTSAIRPRELLVETGGGWCAYFDCGLLGTDATAPVEVLSRTIQCQGLAVMAMPRTAGLPGVQGGRAGAVSFELFSPLPTAVRNSVRAVAAVHDGTRWEFALGGTEQWFEETKRYSAPRVADRFTSDMLERYCQALGVDVFDAEAYGPAAALVETDLKRPRGAKVMSLEEAQTWLDIWPGQAAEVPG